MIVEIFIFSVVKKGREEGREQPQPNLCSTHVYAPAL
jgi:hypothetical protein